MFITVVLRLFYICGRIAGTEAERRFKVMFIDRIFKTQKKASSAKELAENVQAFTVTAEEMQQMEFTKLLYDKIFETERDLHDEEDPLIIATRVMRTACELYEANWCGILIADLQTQAFIPEIWYEPGKGAMKDTLFNDIEFTEEFATWAQHLIDQKPLIIPDAEELKETNPKEYEAYQRLEARSILGVPFGQHPLGFMVARNPKRYGDRHEPLQLACFVAMMMLEQVRRGRIEKLTHLREENDGKFHIRYNVLGAHNMVVDGRKVYEEDLPHPNRRAWIVLLYLALHRQPVELSRVIAENWPDDQEEAAKNAIRQSLFRFHNDLSAYHDIKVVDTRGGKLSFSDDVRIDTDAAELEELYKRAQHTKGTDQLELLKKAFELYRGRLFLQGEGDVGDWLVSYTSHYNQVYVDVTIQLLKVLGHRRDYHCIMDYAPKALELEPGIQEAYYWLVVAADMIGNSVAKEKALEKAKDNLIEEEYAKLLQLLELTGHGNGLN